MQIISISYEHKILIEKYTQTVLETIRLITGQNKAKYTDFEDVYKTIIDYHNTYKHNLEPGNFYDFMSIIPTNLSVAAKGFLVGYETKRNAAKIRAFKIVLDNLAYELVEDLQTIKLYND